jgi:transglutaminase-like putative cysteine protease
MKIEGSIISAIRDAKTGSRIIVGGVLFFFSWMNVAQAVAAVKDVAVLSAPHAQAASAYADVANALETVLDEKLDSIARKAAIAKAKKQKVDYRPEREMLKQLQSKLKERDQKALEDFQDDLAHIEKYRLPAVIRQRHDAAQARFEREAATVQLQLAALQSVDDNTMPARAQSLQEHLQSLMPKQHAPFDPKNPPFKVASGNVRKPAGNTKDLQYQFNRHLNHVSATLPTSQRTQEITEQNFAKMEQRARKVDGYHYQPEPIEVASAGMMSGLLAISAYMPPAQDDLAATEDAQITPDIQALAAQLHNNPVEIYNWTHDSIDFIPTMGSIQGSARTLQTRKANAIDTASLLIALLRASGIPARYAYGTINAPVAAVENWVGGAETPEVAMELLGQGGIPNQGLVTAGNIVAIQLEHVWVEAYVSNVPSRGVKNGGSQEWVSMDASFKQYTFQPGMNIISNPPFDTQAEFGSVLDNASYEPSTGAINGLNPASIDSSVLDMLSKFTSYERSQESQGVSGPFKDKEIVYSPADQLPSGLPYQVVAKGWSGATLPDSLRTSFSVVLSGDPFGSNDGSDAVTYQASLPSISGKNIAIHFVPAGPEDSAAIASYFPPKADGNPYTLAELPRTLRGYNIHLVAQITLDGEVKAQGGQFALGDAVSGDISISQATGQLLEAKTDATAGEYIQIALDTGLSIGDHDMSDQVNNVTQISEASIGYWSAVEQYLDVLRGLGLALSYRQPSFGAFSTRLETQYSYGVPNIVSLKGTRYDIGGSLVSLVAQPSSQVSSAQMNQTVGMVMSAMEHVGPDGFFASTDYPAQAVSAVSAITLALQNGATAYLVDSSNLSTASARINASPAIMQDIANAVNAGNQVLIADQDVNVNGLVSRGYITSDPQTGSGAYKVSTGANGGPMNTDVGAGLAAMGLGFLDIGMPKPFNNADSVCNRVHQKVKVSLGDKVADAVIMTLIIILTIITKRPPVPGAIPPLAVEPILSYFVSVHRALSLLTGGQKTCAIYGSGNKYLGTPMPETTQHVADAQGLIYLTYLGVGKRWPSDWYNSTATCNRAARNAFSAARGGQLSACDEYPFASTVQGGELNNPSLRLVPLPEASPQGNSLRWFYEGCEVSAFDDFEVIANTAPGSTTRGTNGSGAICMGN